MHSLIKRIDTCLISAGLRGTCIRYPYYIDKTVHFDGENQTTAYTYDTHIPEYLFINKRDQWDVGMVNVKIQNFNDICSRRIKIAEVKLEPFHTWGSNTDTTLEIQFIRK